MEASEPIKSNKQPMSDTDQDYEDPFGELGDAFSQEDDVRETFELTFAIRSRRFRCSATGRLMTNPFEALNEGLVDESQLESLDSVRRDRYRPNEALREDIRWFSKETICSLADCLRSSDLMPALIDIAEECLSVLCPERDKQTFKALFFGIELGQLESLMQNLQLRGLDLTELRRSLVRLEDFDSAEATIKQAYQSTKQLILRLFGREEAWKSIRPKIKWQWYDWYLPDVNSLLEVVFQGKLYWSDCMIISSAFTKEVETLKNFSSLESKEAHQLMVDAHLAKLHDIEALVTDLVSRKPIEVLPQDPSQPLEEYYCTTSCRLLKIKIIKGVASLTPVIKLFTGSRWSVIDAVKGLIYKYEHDRFSTLDLRRDLAEAVLPSPIETQRPSFLVGYEGVVYSIGRNSIWYEYGPECERYFISARRWESLPPLHANTLVYFSVVLESTECLYALGNGASSQSVLVQELNLRTLTWRVLGSFKGTALLTNYYFKGSSTSEFYFIDRRSCYAFRPGKDNFTVEKIADTRSGDVQIAMILRGHLVYAGRDSLEVLVEKLKD
jgi:hypothetical protein